MLGVHGGFLGELVSKHPLLLTVPFLPKERTFTNNELHHLLTQEVQVAATKSKKPKLPRQRRPVDERRQWLVMTPYYCADPFLCVLPAQRWPLNAPLHTHTLPCVGQAGGRVRQDHPLTCWFLPPSRSRLLSPPGSAGPEPHSLRAL